MNSASADINSDFRTTHVVILAYNTNSDFRIYSWLMVKTNKYVKQHIPIQAETLGKYKQ